MNARHHCHSSTRFVRSLFLQHMVAPPADRGRTTDSPAVTPCVRRAWRQGMHATHGRALLSMGPIKDVERATVKREEYEAEIKEGIKLGVLDGRQLSGVDYVLDWLRATVSTDDPYVIFIFFLMLRRSPRFTVQRIKNKIAYPASTDGPNVRQCPASSPGVAHTVCGHMRMVLRAQIRTNVLINLLLLYPHDASDFATAPLDLLGPFDETLAGKPLVACEVQVTLKDFLIIKRLMHSYYNIERSADPSFVFKKPVFLAPGLKELTPAVVLEQ